MNFIKEVIISLLVCLLVLVGLSFAFYNFIPTNKVIPEKIEYKASEEIKQELGTEVNNNSENIIKTYEITANDLDQYQKNKDYNPGKKNPFAAVSQGSSDNTADGSTSTDNTLENNKGGSLFESAGTK